MNPSATQNIKDIIFMCVDFQDYASHNLIQYLDTLLLNQQYN